MTTPRTIPILVGPAYLTTTTYNNPAQRGRIMGRGFVMSQSKQCTIGDVVAWPHATDFNGQAFPSGLLGVTWGDTYTNTLTVFNDNLIAVPETLPSGYLARPDREHARRITGSYTIGQMAPITLGSLSFERFTGWTADNTGPRLRSAEGLVDYDWFPENLGVSGGTHTDVTGGGTFAPVTGLRYVRGTFSALPSADYSRARWRVGRKPDGTAIGGADYDANGLLTLGDTFYQSAEITAFPYDSGYLFHDGGTYDFHCPDGSRSYVYVINDYYYTAGAYWVTAVAAFYEGYFRYYYGPRLDIPFPFTVCGRDNMVAAGGILPGYLPGYP